MLAWMDLEMTGLEPDRHVIVEIATLVRDPTWWSISPTTHWPR